MKIQFKPKHYHRAKVNIGALKRLTKQSINEILGTDDEQNDTPREYTDAEKLSKDSVDEQIDSILIEFERNSISDDNNDIEAALESRSLMSIMRLNEKKNDNKDNEDESDDEQSDAEPDKEEKDDLDIKEFTLRVARLHKNYARLLDIQGVILARTKKFISETHSDDVAELVMEYLADTHGVYDEDNEPVDTVAPSAKGADAPYGGG